MKAGLVSIIGPPAVGKTTLAQFLAAALPARLLPEDYTGNPFLSESYAGTPDAMLPCQVYFLMSRFAQLRSSAFAGQGIAVSDYGFCQDRIYAARRLGEEDMAVYERLAESLSPLVRQPDVLVHMDASEATLLSRIARRGRAFERTIDRQFLADMRLAYNAAVADVACPVLTVDCDATDLLGEAARSALLERIRNKLCT